MRLTPSLVAILSLCSSAPALAQTADSGTVARLYVSGTQIAVQLAGGFPNASAGGECASNNDWAGLLTADPVPAGSARADDGD